MLLNEIYYPKPEEFPVYDERNGIKALDWRRIVQQLGDENTAQGWLKRAGNLVSIYKSPDGRIDMNNAYQQAKQDGKQYVVIVG